MPREPTGPVAGPGTASVPRGRRPAGSSTEPREGAALREKWGHHRAIETELDLVRLRYEAGQVDAAAAVTQIERIVRFYSARLPMGGRGRGSMSYFFLRPPRLPPRLGESTARLSSEPGVNLGTVRAGIWMRWLGSRGLTP
jgi:hypothetical protein